MLLTLETDFFGSFHEFFTTNKMTESRATEQKKNWFCIRHGAGIWIFLFLLQNKTGAQSRHCAPVLSFVQLFNSVSNCSKLF